MTTPVSSCNSPLPARPASSSASRPAATANCAKARGAARGAAVEVLLGVEVLDLAADLHGQALGVAERDAPDAVAAAAQTLPERGRVAADWRDGADAGNEDAMELPRRGHAAGLRDRLWRNSRMCWLSALGWSVGTACPASSISETREPGDAAVQALDRLGREHVGLGAAHDHDRALDALDALPEVGHAALAGVRVGRPGGRVAEDRVEVPDVRQVLAAGERPLDAAVELLRGRVGVELLVGLDGLVEADEAVGRGEQAAQRLDAAAQHLGSGLDHDQRGDDVRVLGGVAERVGAAHRLPDDRHVAQPEGLDERLEVLDLAVAAVVVVARAGAAAVSALVEGEHAVLARQLDRDLLPDGGGLSEAVQQQQRLLAA